MILTANNVIEELGLGRALPAHLSEDFFTVLREILLRDGRAEPVVETDPSLLPARIPGSAIILRTGKPTEKELLVLIAAVGFAAFNPVTLVGAAVALVDRFSRLSIEAGELSVVRALGSSRRTAADIAADLAGKWCPTPTQGCVFLDDSRCRIDSAGVDEVLRRLEQEGLVESFRMLEPPQYRFTG